MDWLTIGWWLLVWFIIGVAVSLISGAFLRWGSRDDESYPKRNTDDSTRP